MTPNRAQRCAENFNPWKNKTPFYFDMFPWKIKTKYDYMKLNWLFIEYKWKDRQLIAEISTVIFLVRKSKIQKKFSYKKGWDCVIQEVGDVDKPFFSNWTLVYFISGINLKYNFVAFSST